MDLKKAISNFVPIIDGKKRKLKTINNVLNSKQENNNVINIHRYDINNVGDYYCAPHLYFDQLKNKYLDISDAKHISLIKRKNWQNKVSDNSLIIGGGGLLNLLFFEDQMKLFEQLHAKGKKTILWGLGHNAIDYKSFNKNKVYNIDVSKFGLVGTRDYSMNNNWVPCVSCLHEIFDKPQSVSQEVGILFGKKSSKNKKLQKKLEQYPTCSNMTSINEMVSFIGKSDVLVTDSYHAMYWGFLLEKKVVVIPTTSKFFDFKYKPVISSFDTFETDINKASSYTGILEECRQINLNFADKVFNYLNI